MRKRPAIVSAVVLSAITLLAAVLRLFRIDAQSLWYDEAFSVYLARMGLAEITARTAADIQPPLYYYLLHVWMQLFGQGGMAVRLLSLVFGVLTVPLAYAVAKLLFRSRVAGLLAAALIAISPLHLWYSQEVRMYTLLTFLCLLSGYLLLRIIERTNRLPAETGTGVEWEEVALWVAYALTSIAAVYTHYFAFFLLAFQGVYLILVWAGRGFRPVRLVWGGLASGAAILLLYLPWLPHVLARYGADASYIPGVLKLPEVLVDIAISYVGGESITERTGILLAIGYGVAAGLCLVALASQAVRSSRAAAGSAEDKGGRPEARHPGVQYPLAFLLLYLLLPPILILILSYDAPKFNARYVMMSQPALLLILAGGCASLVERPGATLRRLLRWAAAALVLVLVAGVALYADYQAYTSEAFSRADFRGVARYIREHIQPDETVILSSGHMFPAFDLYAPGMQRLLLPDSATLDTTRTLDYSIAGDLNRWLAGKRGVWVVLWQDDVVDPVGILPTLLGGVGEEQDVGESFAQIGLRYYRLPADLHFSDKPLIEHPLSYNFGNMLQLLGYSQTGLQEVTLFWQALQPLEEDYLVSLVLRDTNNQVWGQCDGRPSAYMYPTTRWQPGQVVPGRMELVPMRGTPPGDYGLDVGVYTEEDQAGLDVLDPAGAAQGKRAMLGAVRLSVPAVSAAEIELSNQVQAEMGGGLSLVGWELNRYEAQPGDRLLLTLAWSVDAQPEGDYRARLLVIDATGQRFEAGTFAPTNAWHPTSIWQAGQAWLGQSTIRVPINAQPGQARLGVDLVDGNGVALGQAVELGAIEVLPTTRSFVPPKPQAPRDTSFDDKVTLLGADLVPNPVRPGAVLSVVLYWQANADMDIPYTAFVHLLGPDGQVVAGQDGQPVGGTRPTTGWVPGEYVADAHQVTIPADLPPGEYVVEVGLYDGGIPAMPRLPVLGDEGQQETDRVIFGPVEVR